MKKIPDHSTSVRRCTAALFLAATALAGCGGSDGGAPPPPAPAPAPAPNPPPPPANQPPVAAFAAAATAQAGVPLPLDASGSTDPDNDPLTFSWSFGDGTRGGGAQLAHMFTTAGAFTVTLDVADGRGGTARATRTVNVSAGPAPGASAQVQAVVSDGAGPLSGVAVSVVDGTAMAATGADGKADIAVGTGPAQQLKFSRAGYADQFKSVQLGAGATGASIEVRMLAREAALTLADAAAGGTLLGKDGARVVIPANALVDANGQPVAGAVQVNVTPVDVGRNPGAFPGAFQGFQPSGARGLIASYGTVEYVFTQNGAPVQLAPGRKATIEIPIYTSRNLDGSDVVAGASIPLWSLDERTALWVQEGSGTVVANTASPSELALRAEVGHFSWWNCDQWLGLIPEDSFNPNTRCCIRDTPGGPCKENSGDICNVSGSPRPINASQPVRPFAVDPATRRVPTTVATATVPALAGGVLPMPANLDIDVVASARNGTYRGTKTFRGGRGVSETVSVDLLPLAGGGNDDPIALPWDQVYSMAATGEIDRYRLALPVGAGFELRVAPAASSLAGTVRVIRPGGAVIANLPFNASSTAYVAEQTVATAGDYQIEITAGSGAPGAYRLDAVSFGACSSTETLSPPAAPTVNLGPNQSRCYDIALAADEVIQADIGQINNGITGSVSLATGDGVQTLAAREYPINTGSRRILAGVSVAGTYRLRAANRTLNTGSFTLTVSKPAAQVLAVPASTSFSDLAAGTPRLFLVKPAADGLVYLSLGNTGGQVGAQFEPSLASFLVATQTSARVQRVAAPLLPVASVFRNTGSGTVTVATGTPTSIGRDTDVSGSVAAGTPAVYAFDGAIGDAIAYALARPEASTSTAALGVFAPSGAALNSTNPVHTLAESGAYTALATASSGADNPLTLRINTAPAPVALALTPPVTSRTVDLPLGQVLRYTFDVTQGELIGVQLATTGALNASAVIGGVQDAFISTPTAGTGPFNAASPPRFVNTSANATLTLRSTAGAIERARGNVTIGVVRPVPAAASFNLAVNGTLAPNEWTSYRYSVPASGRYLLRLSTTAAGAYGLTATAWAPTSIFTGYAGEFASSVSNLSVPIEGLGLLGPGEHTVTVASTLGSAAVPFSMTLVNLEDPVPLVLGAGATAGAIDTDGERDYASFAGVGGQTYTLRVTAAFNGTLRVRKLAPNGDYSNRVAEQNNLGGTPQALAASVERVVSFTIPATTQFGDGSYIVEIGADGSATGAYQVQVTSP